MTQRYTRYVKTLRLILPVLAGISLLALLIWPWWQEKQQYKIKQAHETRLSQQDAQRPVSDAPLQVQKPEYHGVDQAGRPYYITAERVEQALDAKVPMVLIRPQASLHLDATAAPHHQTVTLQADQGLYDLQAQIIDLKGNVTLNYAGYTIIADDLALDMTGAAAATNSSVSGHGPRGTLEATRLMIKDKGTRLVLKGPGRLVFKTDSPSSQMMTD